MAHELPPLPYPKEALEPHIDALTMEIHHDRHHKAYVDNLNKAIAGNAALEAKSLDALIKDLASVPDNIRGPERNNGGGHWNHSFFWKLMAPKAGGAPTDLRRAFDRRMVSPPPAARIASWSSRRVFAYRSAREPIGRMIAANRDPASPRGAPCAGAS